MRDRPVCVALVAILVLLSLGSVRADEPQFARGDCNGDGVVVPFVDGVFLLVWGFNEGPAPPCKDAADADDNGAASPLNDGLYLLTWAFADGPAPPDPGPLTCGIDPTADSSGCETVPACTGEVVKPPLDEEILLAVSDASAIPDSVAVVDITLSSEGDENACAYQFSVCYDNAVVTTETGNVVRASDQMYYFWHSIQFDSDDFSVNAVTSFAPIIEVDVSPSLTLYNVYFNTLSELGSTSIELCESDDVSPIVVLMDGTPLTPVTVSGSITIVDPAEIVFLRGDVNGNGQVAALPDALFLLSYGFLDGTTPPCLDAADANDAGGVSAIIDAIYLLTWGFGGGEAPPAPGTEECGTDPTTDGVLCATPPTCE